MHHATLAPRQGGGGWARVESWVRPLTANVDWLLRCFPPCWASLGSGTQLRQICAFFFCAFAFFVLFFLHAFAFFALFFSALLLFSHSLSSRYHFLALFFLCFLSSFFCALCFFLALFSSRFCFFALCFLHFVFCTLISSFFSFFCALFSLRFHAHFCFALVSANCNRSAQRKPLVATTVARSWLGLSANHTIKFCNLAKNSTIFLAFRSYAIQFWFGKEKWFCLHYLVFKNL